MAISASAVQSTVPLIEIAHGLIPTRCVGLYAFVHGPDAFVQATRSCRSLDKRASSGGNSAGTANCCLSAAATHCLMGLCLAGIATCQNSVALSHMLRSGDGTTFQHSENGKEIRDINAPFRPRSKWPRLKCKMEPVDKLPDRN